MSTGTLKQFYTTQKWVKCRRAFFISKFGLCELCGKPAEIVHHRVPLSAGDIKTNLAKCYGWDNLQLLCRICHELQHSSRADGLGFDSNGNIVFTQTAKQLGSDTS